MSFTFVPQSFTEYPPVSPGEYAAVLHSATPKQGAKGTYLALRFSITGDELKRQVWMNASLSDNSLWRIAQLTETLGIELSGSEFKNRKEFENELIGQLENRPCRVVVSNEVYEDVVRDRVDEVKSA